MASQNFCFTGSALRSRRQAFTTNSSYCRLSCRFWCRFAPFCFTVFTCSSWTALFSVFFSARGGTGPPGSSTFISITLFIFANEFTINASAINREISLEYSYLVVET